jgi:hypothetical protein
MTTTVIESGLLSLSALAVRCRYREMKSKLKALADEADVPASARRVVREYLSRYTSFTAQLRVLPGIRKKKK